MEDWRTDTEKRHDEANSWKLRLEAYVLGVCMIALAIAAIRGVL